MQHYKYLTKEIYNPEDPRTFKSVYSLIEIYCHIICQWLIVFIVFDCRSACACVCLFICKPVIVDPVYFGLLGMLLLEITLCGNSSHVINCVANHV